MGKPTQPRQPVEGRRFQVISFHQASGDGNEKVNVVEGIPIAHYYLALRKKV